MKMDDALPSDGAGVYFSRWTIISNKVASTGKEKVRVKPASQGTEGRPLGFYEGGTETHYCKYCKAGSFGNNQSLCEPSLVIPSLCWQ